MLRFALLAFAITALTSACDYKSSDVIRIVSTSSPTNTLILDGRGVIVDFEPDGRTVKIKHEDIHYPTGGLYMGAMTMPLEARNTNELKELMPGDIVSFQMMVTETDGWIENIKRLNSGRTNTFPNSGPVQITRDVEPINEGDILPDYYFVNQEGERFSTMKFRGKAVAITFLFTRCPLPTFCPLMAKHFAAAQKQLLTMTNAPANWHLLTISFDPEFDKPAVLKSYALGYGFDLKSATFATGELIDITAIGQQLGLNFGRDETGSISHNLRTAVIDPQGRVSKVFIGNQWTSEELAEEVIKAAKK